MIDNIDTIRIRGRFDVSRLANTDGIKAKEIIWYLCNAVDEANARIEQLEQELEELEQGIGLRETEQS